MTQTKRRRTDSESAETNEEQILDEKKSKKVNLKSSQDRPSPSSELRVRSKMGMPDRRMQGGEKRETGRGRRTMNVLLNNASGELDKR